MCLLNCICLNKGSFIHYYVWSEFEQLLDEVFVISRIIKVEVGVISRSLS